MKVLYSIFVLYIVVGLHSCKEKEYSINDSISENYKEEEFYRVQGIIIKSKTNFTYEGKFKRDYEYIYHLELTDPLIGKEINSQLVFSVEDPVAIMVNRKDSTINFIGHRGIINDTLLVEYLTREDGNYETKLINSNR